MTDISHKLKLDINENGILAQFEGYFKLPSLNFENYRKKNMVTSQEWIES